jgi:iron-sulfur cluster assembly protein
MLTLTDTAAEAIRAIVADSEFDDDQAGLRFSLAAAEGDEAQLLVALVPEAADGDEDVEADGAHVFLDEPTSMILADKVLDAFVSEDGELGFQFADKPSVDGMSLN